MTSPNPAQIPQEIHPDTLPAQAARIIILSILVVVAANVGMKAYLYHYPQSEGAKSVIAKWNLIEETEPVDWLILGDSTLEYGLDPTILEDEFGITALNAATIGDWQMIDNVLLLEAYLERHNAPSVIILGHTFNTWGRPYPEIAVAVQSPITVHRFESSRLEVRYDAVDYLTIVARRNIPLYFSDRSVAVLLSPAALDFELSNKGFHASSLHLNEEEIASMHDNIGVFDLGEVFLAEHNLEALMLFLSIAEENGIRVYLVQTPLYEEVFTLNPDFPEAYDNLSGELQEIANSTPTLTYIENPYRVAVEQLANTVDHVNGEAANQYSMNLADVLRQYEGE